MFSFSKSRWGICSRELGLLKIKQMKVPAHSDVALFLQKTVQALKESHDLIERHITTSNQQRAKVEALQQALDSVQASLVKLKSSYDGKVKELEVEKAAYEKEEEAWKAQVGWRCLKT